MCIHNQTIIKADVELLDMLTNNSKFILTVCQITIFDNTEGVTGIARGIFRFVPLF
jgi:hypothetical protein